MQAAAATYDVVISIEGPHRQARAAAWVEMHRVLKPGGHLIASDLLGHPARDWDASSCQTADQFVAAYEGELLQAGFDNGRVLNVTRKTWQVFRGHSSQHYLVKLLFQEIDRDQFDSILAALPGGELLVAAYVLAYARKPPSETSVSIEEFRHDK